MGGHFFGKPSKTIQDQPISHCIFFVHRELISSPLLYSYKVGFPYVIYTHVYHACTYVSHIFRYMHPICTSFPLVVALSWDWKPLMEALRSTELDLREQAWGLGQCVNCQGCAMYVCIYICTCICTYVHMYICTYVHMYICTYVHMYICIYVYMYICIYVYMYICIYVYMYICIYVYMYIYPQNCQFHRQHQILHRSCSSECRVARRKALLIVL